MAEVSLHAAAVADYEAALAWYLARSARAATGFATIASSYHMLNRRNARRAIFRPAHS